MNESSEGQLQVASQDRKIAKNYFHVLWRAPALLVWIIVMPLVFFLFKLVGSAFHKEIPHFFHQGVQKILGLRVKYSGELHKEHPTLFVSNHISYLDVFVLGGIRAYFIAKSEVAGWPVLGQLARFQNTLFIERSAGKARQQLKIMQSHLREGNSLILFPEGTSTDGVHVEPFKSSLFEAANLEESETRVSIQAITVAYTHQAGKKMNQEMRDYYAWYATMPFGPHFRNLFALQKVDVKVHFHPVCYLDQFESRKQCADHCELQVSNKLTQFTA
ncbi:MAG: lysophospholipid acyltransferase family protein [Pseudomonadota bacterium]